MFNCSGDEDSLYDCPISKNVSCESKNTSNVVCNTFPVKHFGKFLWPNDRPPIELNFYMLADTNIRNYWKIPIISFHIWLKYLEYDLSTYYFTNVECFGMTDYWHHFVIYRQVLRKKTWVYFIRIWTRIVREQGFWPLEHKTAKICAKFLLPSFKYLLSLLLFSLWNETWEMVIDSCGLVVMVRDHKHLIK